MGGSRRLELEAILEDCLGFRTKREDSIIGGGNSLGQEVGWSSGFQERNLKPGELFFGG